MMKLLSIAFLIGVAAAFEAYQTPIGFTQKHDCACLTVESSQDVTVTDDRLRNSFGMYRYQAPGSWKQAIGESLSPVPMGVTSGCGKAYSRQVFGAPNENPDAPRGCFWHTRMYSAPPGKHTRLSATPSPATDNHWQNWAALWPYQEAVDIGPNGDPTHFTEYDSASTGAGSWLALAGKPFTPMWDVTHDARLQVRCHKKTDHFSFRDPITHVFHPTNNWCEWKPAQDVKPQSKPCGCVGKNGNLFGMASNAQAFCTQVAHEGKCQQIGCEWLGPCGDTMPCVCEGGGNCDSFVDEQKCESNTADGFNDSPLCTWNCDAEPEDCCTGGEGNDCTQLGALGQARCTAAYGGGTCSWSTDADLCPADDSTTNHPEPTSGVAMPCVCEGGGNCDSFVDEQKCESNTADGFNDSPLCTWNCDAEPEDCCTGGEGNDCTQLGPLGQVRCTAAYGGGTCSWSTDADLCPADDSTNHPEPTSASGCDANQHEIDYSSLVKLLQEHPCGPLSESLLSSYNTYVSNWAVCFPNQVANIKNIVSAKQRPCPSTASPSFPVDCCTGGEGNDCTQYNADQESCESFQGGRYCTWTADADLCPRSDSGNNALRRPSGILETPRALPMSTATVGVVNCDNPATMLEAMNCLQDTWVDQQAQPTGEDNDCCESLGTDVVHTDDNSTATGTSTGVPPFNEECYSWNHVMNVHKFQDMGSNCNGWSFPVLQQTTEADAIVEYNLRIDGYTQHGKDSIAAGGTEYCGLCPKHRERVPGSTQCVFDIDIHGRHIFRCQSTEYCAGHQCTDDRCCQSTNNPTGQGHCNQRESQTLCENFADGHWNDYGALYTCMWDADCSI